MWTLWLRVLPTLVRTGESPATQTSFTDSRTVSSPLKHVQHNEMWLDGNELMRPRPVYTIRRRHLYSRCQEVLRSRHHACLFVANFLVCALSETRPLIFCAIYLFVYYENRTRVQKKNRIKAKQKLSKRQTILYYLVNKPSLFFSVDLVGSLWFFEMYKSFDCH